MSLLTWIEKVSLRYYQQRHLIPGFVYRKVERALEERFLRDWMKPHTSIFVRCIDKSQLCIITVLAPQSNHLSFRDQTQHIVAKSSIKAKVDILVKQEFRLYVSDELASQVTWFVQFARIEDYSFVNTVGRDYAKEIAPKYDRLSS